MAATLPQDRTVCLQRLRASGNRNGARLHTVEHHNLVLWLALRQKPEGYAWVLLELLLRYTLSYGFTQLTTGKWSLTAMGPRIAHGLWRCTVKTL